MIHTIYIVLSRYSKYYILYKNQERRNAEFLTKILGGKAMILLIMHIALVILSIANAVIVKGKMQKFTWSAMALCWFIMSVSEIATMM